MKKINYFILILTLFFINITFVSANSINRIDIDVKLDDKGNGIITEKWDMKVDEGTEVYKSLTDLGNSTISNLKVIDETGKEFVHLEKWKTDALFSDKAYKSGINKVSNGVELCWGMSSYGSHIYTISYEVSNMIYNVEDAQTLYWRFIDNNSMNPYPKEFSVTISGLTPYEDKLDVWGYGYKGYGYVKNGKIYMSNEENTNLSKNNYIVLLVKFPLNTFNINNSIDKFNTFNDFYNQAEEGTFEYNYDNDGDGFIAVLFIFLQFLFFFFVGGFILSSAKSNNYLKKDIDKKNLNNFRDIPCNKDVFLTYFLADIYSLNKKKEDLLGALLLKWLKDSQIEIIKQNKNGLFGSKEITAIQLKENITFSNQDEQDLYDMLISASKDMLLEEDELKKWCKNNYSKFFKWFDNIKNNVRDDLIEKNHITIVQNGKMFKTKNYQLDDYLYEEATKLAGLKKFLIEFSRIKEKQPIEVKLWEYYLIDAQIFGIAKEVTKQFKDLYPELVEQTNYSGLNYMDIIWLNNIATSSVSAASSARSAAQSYSAGGGGFSSGGGGGGSFGGGGGGCR